MLTDNVVEIQCTFLNELSVFINGSIYSKFDLFCSFLNHKIPFLRHAQAICNKYKVLSAKIQMDEDPYLIKIERYNGKNHYVHKMINYLSEHSKDDLIGVYVHGSLGTCEEIPYSDFDTLVIIKKEVFENPKRLSQVAHMLYHAKSIMYDFDPLQHHGWFVLTDSDLKAYPNYYFPVDLFQHAKSLFTDKRLNLTVHLNYSPEMNRKVFDELSNKIIKLINAKQYPRNIYQLKGLLSKFMLLPAYYIQARDNKGIFKKFSYDSVKLDFSHTDWAIMEEVSLIRKKWSYSIKPLRRWLITQNTPISRFFAKKFAPSIPPKIKELLTDAFYRRMGHLTSLMQRNLN